MLKLAIDTHVPRSLLGDAGFLKLLAETGFEEADLSFHGAPASDPLLGENWEKETVKLKQAMSAYGIACSQCHAPDETDGLKPFSEDSPAYRRAVRAVRSAGLLGADHIALHSLYLPSLSPEEEWERNLEYFSSFEPVCRESGVRIALENLPIQVTDTPEQIGRFLKELASPWYGVLLDTGHAVISGTAPEAYLRRLPSGSLIGVHVQDLHGKKDEHLIPWMGEICWERFAQALAEADYRGTLALEVIHFMEHIPKELLKPAHAYAAAAGKELIRMTEEARIRIKRLNAAAKLIRTTEEARLKNPAAEC